MTDPLPFTRLVEASKEARDEMCALRSFIESGEKLTAEDRARFNFRLDAYDAALAALPPFTESEQWQYWHPYRPFVPAPTNSSASLDYERCGDCGKPVLNHPPGGNRSRTIVTGEWRPPTSSGREETP